jgi:ketosteroid isomerase-like protein
MSQENVKLTHGGFAPYNRAGIDAMLDYFDPSAELIAPPNWPEERVLHGHAGVRQVMAGWDEQFGGYRLDLQRVIDAGDDSVLALSKNYVRIEGSDREFVQPRALHLGFRGAKITRWHAYFSWEEALAAVGLEV